MRVKQLGHQYGVVASGQQHHVFPRVSNTFKTICQITTNSIFRKTYLRFEEHNVLFKPGNICQVHITCLACAGAGAGVRGWEQ